MTRSYLIAALVMIAMPSAHAKVVAPSLQCEAVCPGQSLSDCGLHDWKPFQLKVHSNGRKAFWIDSTKGAPLAGVVGPTPEGETVYDFGVGARGGDQYSFFSFYTMDLDALSAGKVSSILGEYEDAYDWADGYHIRAQIKVRCTSK